MKLFPAALLCALSVVGATGFGLIRGGSRGPMVAAPAALKLPLRCVFLGDSISNAGRAVSGVAAIDWPNRTDKFSALGLAYGGFGYMVNDGGISGDSLSGALARMDLDVVGWQPDLVTVLLGRNDIGSSAKANPQPLATMQGKMMQIIGRLRAAGIPHIVLCSIPPCDDATDAQRDLTDAWNAWLMGPTFTGPDLLKVDMWPAVTDPATRKYREGFRLQTNGANTTDLIHPGTLGKETMARLWAGSVGSWLGVSQANTFSIGDGVGPNLLQGAILTKTAAASYGSGAISGMVPTGYVGMISSGSPTGTLTTVPNGKELAALCVRTGGNGRFNYPFQSYDAAAVTGWGVSPGDRVAFSLRVYASDLNTGTAADPSNARYYVRFTAGKEIYLAQTWTEPAMGSSMQFYDVFTWPTEGTTASWRLMMEPAFLPALGSVGTQKDSALGTLGMSHPRLVNLSRTVGTYKKDCWGVLTDGSQSFDVSSQARAIRDAGIRFAGAAGQTITLPDARSMRGAITFQNSASVPVAIAGVTPPGVKQQTIAVGGLAVPVQTIAAGVSVHLTPDPALGSWAQS